MQNNAVLIVFDKLDIARLRTLSVIEESKNSVLFLSVVMVKKQRREEETMPVSATVQTAVHKDFLGNKSP